GYLTVVHEDRSGWTGGLLVLNRGGRPMEFQCTLPIRPSRAHAILYGSTLREHLIQDVIAPALLARCRNAMDLMVTDLPEALALVGGTSALGGVSNAPGGGSNALGDGSNMPVGLACEAAGRHEGPIEADSVIGFTRVPIANSEFFLPDESLDTLQPVIAALADLPDADEPFERIRAAIDEAHQQMARAAAAEARGRGNDARGRVNESRGRAA
ncbi:MAG: hypothetical protein AAF958_10305, partial [Planctomycetota bacterium]